jgi:hypothetical protein
MSFLSRGLHRKTLLSPSVSLRTERLLAEGPLGAS